MTVTCVDHDAAFASLRQEWSVLLSRSRSDCLFLTWEWLHTWWKHLSGSRKLCVLAARDNGELTGLAPWATRRAQFSRLIPFRAIEFLGSGTIGSDYLDLIVLAGREEETLEALSRHLGRSGRMLELSQLRAGCAAARLAAMLAGRGWRCAHAKTNVCPFIPLRGHSWESYLATVGPEHRYAVQRKLRKLSREFDVQFEPATNEEQREKALDALIGLHQKRWERREGESDAFHTPGHLAFHRELTRLALERGWLRLFVLRLNGKPVSALYGFLYGGKFYFYQSGFDPDYSRYSVGLVTMALAIQSAIGEGAAEYDLLHGGEAYKFHWARETRDLGRVELFPPGVRGLLCRSLVPAARSARRVARRVLQPASAEELVTSNNNVSNESAYASWPRKDRNCLGVALDQQP